MMKKVKLFNYLTGPRSLCSTLERAEKEVNDFTSTHKTIDINVSITSVGDDNHNALVVFAVTYEHY